MIYYSLDVIHPQILASAASNVRTQSPELQKANSGGSGAGTGNATPDSSPNPNSSATTSQPTLTNTDEEKKRRILEQIDWRNYECKTWHLEPTVRYDQKPILFL